MALFCTDTFHDIHAAEIATVAPGLDVVVLRAGEEVSAADIERITIAFFSSDVWPERTGAFFKVALAATNLRWFHSMSAGVDSPVFASFLERGARLTTSSGATAPPIASTVMLYLLALSRDLPRWLRAQAAHLGAPARLLDLVRHVLADDGNWQIRQGGVRLGTAVPRAPLRL